MTFKVDFATFRVAFGGAVVSIVAAVAVVLDVSTIVTYCRSFNHGIAREGVSEMGHTRSLPMKRRIVVCCRCCWLKVLLFVGCKMLWLFLIFRMLSCLLRLRFLMWHDVGVAPHVLTQAGTFPPRGGGTLGAVRVK